MTENYPPSSIPPNYPPAPGEEAYPSAFEETANPPVPDETAYPLVPDAGNYPPAPEVPSYLPAAEPPGYLPPAPQTADWNEAAPGGLSTDTGVSGDGQGTADIVKDQAADLGQNAVQAGKHAASTAKEQTAAVTAEAARQGMDLAHQARSELTAQAAQQQQRLAGSLHALGDELSSMANGSQNPGVATDLVHQAAGTTKHVASWLEDREPGQLLEDVKTFARQRPGLFIAIAAGIGVAAGRLTRGLTDSSSDDDSGTPAPVQQETLPPLPELTVPDVAPADEGFAPTEGGFAPVNEGFAPVPDQAPTPSIWDSPAPAERPAYPGQPEGTL